MLGTHYFALVISYAVASLGFLAVARLLPNLWPPAPAPSFTRPWREVGWALLAVLAVLGIGQLYSRNWLLPRGGSLGILFESINQIVIFAPLLILLRLRRQPLSTAWIRRDGIGTRILTGLCLALLALFTFSVLRRDAVPFLTLLGGVYQLHNVPYAVQVFCEDMAIAIVFVRVRASMGLGGAIVLVAALFAAAHIPALLQQGATPRELAHLVLDTGLGVGLLWVLQRSADIWWFWCVHFALDMTQYYGVAGNARP